MTEAEVRHVVSALVVDKPGTLNRPAGAPGGCRTGGVLVQWGCNRGCDIGVERGQSAARGNRCQ